MGACLDQGTCVRLGGAAAAGFWRWRLLVGFKGGGLEHRESGGIQLGNWWFHEVEFDLWR